VVVLHALKFEYVVPDIGVQHVLQVGFSFAEAGDVVGLFQQEGETEFVHTAVFAAHFHEYVALTVLKGAHARHQFAECIQRVEDFLSLLGECGLDAVAAFIVVLVFEVLKFDSVYFIVESVVFITCFAFACKVNENLVHVFYVVLVFVLYLQVEVLLVRFVSVEVEEDRLHTVVYFEFIGLVFGVDHAGQTDVSHLQSEWNERTVQIRLAEGRIGLVEGCVGVVQLGIEAQKQVVMRVLVLRKWPFTSYESKEVDLLELKHLHDHLSRIRIYIERLLLGSVRQVGH